MTKTSLENPAEGVTVDPETGAQTISWKGVTPGDEPDGYVDATHEEPAKQEQDLGQAPRA
jgi:hypothetical protein